MGAVFAALALGSAGAQARVVDYQIDRATLEQAAADQLDGPLSPPPERGDAQLAFVADPGTDHVTISAGVACSAYKVENPVSQMLVPLLQHWDADGTLGGADAITLRLTRASSFNRCVQLKEFDGRCITRVRLAGTLSLRSADGATADVPVSANVERSGTVGGFCGNLARFIGMVSREAGIALLADARAKLASR